MREYGFGRIRVSENPYLRIFYAVPITLIFVSFLLWLEVKRFTGDTPRQMKLILLHHHQLECSAKAVSGL